MQNHLTLSQLQKLVKATLDEAFALPVWVSAEIAEIKINYSGHCYLELVEKGGDNDVPLSQARAVIWRTAYARIAGYFEAETGQRLAAGIRILARVMISYHELYGFSLNILDIDRPSRWATWSDSGRSPSSGSSAKESGTSTAKILCRR